MSALGCWRQLTLFPYETGGPSPPCRAPSRPSEFPIAGFLPALGRTRLMPYTCPLRGFAMIPFRPTLYRASVLLFLAIPIGFLPPAAAQPPPDQSSVLESVRVSALLYIGKLPDFICTQITHRTSSRAGFSAHGVGNGLNTLGTGTSWDVNDVIEERLTYIGKSEEYEVLQINGKPAKGVGHLQLKGAFSAGEFGSGLHDIFDPNSHTSFSWDRIEHIHGRIVYGYAFRVPQEHGAIVIHRDPDRQVVVPYSGRIFVDPQTFSVLRITSTLDLPAGFPIIHAERMIEYKPIMVANKEYLLPSRSEVHMQDSARSYVNEVDFKDYHKFVAESTIHY